MHDPFLLEHVIDEVIETRYGSTTQLKASINLYKAAWSDPENEYFDLVSSSCWPLRNFGHIYERIFSLDATLFKPLFKLLGRMKYTKDQTIFTKETFHTQATWMVMKRADFSRIDENDMTDSVFGLRVFGVDHPYFINLFELIEMQYTEYPVTWDNWNEPEIRKNPYRYEPKTYVTLDHETITQTVGEDSFFIRKISKDCVVSPQLIAAITSEN